jgi:hypothetical protein
MPAPTALLDRPEPAGAQSDRAECKAAETRAAPPVRRDWTELPEAAALLAGCAADPPASRMVQVADLTTYHARRDFGPRVRKLRAIHRAEAARLFAAAEAARDYRAFEAHLRRSVQDAIADALLHAALARSAACDGRALEVIRCTAVPAGPAK